MLQVDVVDVTYEGQAPVLTFLVYRDAFNDFILSY